MSWDDDKRYELIDGALYDMTTSPPLKIKKFHQKYLENYIPF